MVKKLLEQIKKDFHLEIELNKIEKYDIIALHFGVCAKIRNNYLWNDKQRTKILIEYFDVKDVDTLSAKIWEEITKD